MGGNQALTAAVELLEANSGRLGRRARLEGITGFAALALEMPQDAIHHAWFSNN